MTLGDSLTGRLEYVRGSGLSVDINGETAVEALFAAGDCATVSGGISGAAVLGHIAGEGVVQRIRAGVKAPGAAAPEIEALQNALLDLGARERVLSAEGVFKEVAREVLSKGSWATLMFLFQELDKKAEQWRAPKVAIVRYKKWNGQYRKQSGFNISSEKQARQIIASLENWYGEGGAAAGAGDAGDDAGDE